MPKILTDILYICFLVVLGLVFVTYYFDGSRSGKRSKTKLFKIAFGIVGTIIYCIICYVLIKMILS